MLSGDPRQVNETNPVGFTSRAVVLERRLVELGVVRGDGWSLLPLTGDSQGVVVDGSGTF
jgi:hypothetical protein